MFNRRLSQKPSDSFFKNFRDSFPQLGQNAALDFNSAVSNPTTEPESNDSSALLADAIDDVSADARQSDLDLPHDIKDADATPRAAHESWNFASGLTPSLMDPNSQGFNMFANQVPGYYTPTPGGTNTLYHPQAGDLHTPGGFGIGLGTPLSMPTSEGALHAGHSVAAYANLHQLQHQHQQQQQQQQQQHQHQQQQQQQHHPQPHQYHHFQQAQTFHNINPYQVHHPVAFPPHQFSHQPVLDADVQLGGSPLDDFSANIDMHQPSLARDTFFRSSALSGAVSASALQHPMAENAPTAMVKHSDEIPITYLNKGQAYYLNVLDMKHAHASPQQRYRTFVRVSFEDEQQRSKPAACWQLWKEGRGTNEAHQRGGRLQAVEYVDSSQLSNVEDGSKPRIELESASFDGFCVVWTPQTAPAECTIPVRFNFLSTDFSHSKGVKGIPVRLCAKTEAIDEEAPEVCYCKVKLFRDHGAERKLSNDTAHVNKTIEKLNSQIAQIESGVKDVGKRKRSGSMAKISSGMDSRPNKMAKHRRTWSVTSTTSNGGGGRGSAEDDLHARLMTLRDMHTSTRPVSVLYLRGDPEDDPDDYPVQMNGGDSSDLDRQANDAESASQEGEGAGLTSPQSSRESPTPTASASPETSRRDSTIQPTPLPVPASLPRVTSSEWRAQPQTATADLLPPANIPGAKTQDRSPTKIKTRPSSSQPRGKWVEVVDIDPSYRPPPEPPIKPVACFYVQASIPDRPSSPSSPDRFYRAVYLTQRNVRTFVEALASKCAIEPTQVLRTLRITESGLQVFFDDECVRELPEGQDMKAEFRSFTPDSDADGDADAASTPSSSSSQKRKLTRPKREWDTNNDAESVQIDGDLSTIENVHSVGYELRLSF